MRRPLAAGWQGQIITWLVVNPQGGVPELVLAHCWAEPDSEMGACGAGRLKSSSACW